MTGLEITDLQKRFGDNHVVRGLDLTLEEGEIVALLGPSGCGKTTALRMVAGLESPDSGRIRIAGDTVFEPGRDRPPEARRVGMVFQSYAVWPHRSVRDNVAYPLALARDPEAAAKADRALEQVQLPGLGSRYPDTLSGGQQQRVALARALVAQPKLLLFDEPLSNLDAKLRDQMRHEIRQLAKSVGITSLYVTHDQPEAFAVSDRVAVVLSGRIAQIAPPAELYARPANLEIARFVGRLSELTGAVRAGDDRVRLGAVEIPATFAADGGDVLGVRPEAVEVGPADGPGIPGRVARATYLGERVEVAIETEHGTVRADLDPEADATTDEAVTVRLRRGRVY